MPGLEQLLVDPRTAPQLFRRVAALSPALTPFALDFTAEGGTNGNPVTLSDTGNNGVWDAITIGTGATFAYDNSTAFQGNQSIQVATSATAANCFGRWSSTIASQFLPTNQLWASNAFKFTANPGVSLPVVFARTRIDQGAISIRVHTDGHIRIIDTNSALVSASVNAIPLNAWFRIDTFWQASPTMAVCYVNCYFTNPYALANPDEIVQGGGIAGDDSIFTGYRAGIVGGNVASVGPFWMDRPRISNVGFPPPDPGVFSITLTDPGTGADALVDAAAIALPDPGTGSDAVVIAATAGLSDSAVGSDTVGDAATVTLADPGTSLDAIVAAIAASLTDSGIGTDTVVVVQPKTLADAGVGADALVVAVAAALGDLGEGVDAVVQYFHFGDSGQGSDNPVIAVTLSLGDSGAGTDSLVASPVTLVNLSDAGVGTDTLVAVSDAAQSISLSDSGAGSDSFSVAPAIALNDFGAGSDTVHITVQMWLGFDDPVPEGHAAFDPTEFSAEESLPAKAPFRPVVSGGRKSLILVRHSWDMTAAMFRAHMDHMHNGRDVTEHRNAHVNGAGGNPRHYHG